MYDKCEVFEKLIYQHVGILPQFDVDKHKFRITYTVNNLLIYVIIKRVAYTCATGRILYLIIIYGSKL